MDREILELFKVIRKMQGDEWITNIAAYIWGPIDNASLYLVGEHGERHNLMGQSSRDDFLRKYIHEYTEKKFLRAENKLTEKDIYLIVRTLVEHFSVPRVEEWGVNTKYISLSNNDKIAIKPSFVLYLEREALYCATFSLLNRALADITVVNHHLSKADIQRRYETPIEKQCADIYSKAKGTLDYVDSSQFGFQKLLSFSSYLKQSDNKD